MLRFLGSQSDKKETRENTTVLRQETDFTPRNIANMTGFRETDFTPARRNDHTGRYATRHSQEICSLKQLSDGRLIGSATNSVYMRSYADVGPETGVAINTEIRKWNLSTGELEKNISGSIDSIFGSSLSNILTLQKGCLVFTYVYSTIFGPGVGQSLVIYNPQNGQYKKGSFLYRGPDISQTTICLQLQNERLAIANREKGSPIVVVSKSLSKVRVRIEQEGEITALIQLENGHLVSGSCDGAIHVFDSSDWRCVNVINASGDMNKPSIITLMQHTDGRLIALSSERIEFWNVSSGECEANIRLDESSKRAMAPLSDEISHENYERYVPYDLQKLPDGRLVSIGLIGSRDSELKKIGVKIYDPSTYLCVQTFLASDFTNIMSVSMEVLSDGRLAISEGAMIRIWDIGFRPILDLQSTASMPAHFTSLSEQMTTSSAYDDTRSRKLAMGLVASDITDPLFSLYSTESQITTSSGRSQPKIGKVKADFSDINAPIISFSDLEMSSDRLGTGGFGIVYRGRWQMVSVAIKQLHATRLSEEALASFQEEAQQHGLLRHPNIVMLFGVCLEPSRYSLVMEYMTGGSLYDFLHSTHDILWPVKLSIAHNIAVGLNYLHEHGIIHRDIKSMNVLLDEHQKAKLSDFGLAILKAETQSTASTVTSVPGSIRWMAPELHKRGARCTTATDIFSLGMVYGEICTRKTPFQDEVHATNELIKDWIKDGERDALPADTPPRFAHLLAQCWDKRAERRPVKAKIIAEQLAIIESQEDTVSSGFAYFSTK